MTNTVAIRGWALKVNAVVVVSTSTAQTISSLGTAALDSIAVEEAGA